MRGTRHETPTGFDPFLKRANVSRAEYKAYWSSYWNYRDALDVAYTDAERRYLMDEITDLFNRFSYDEKQTRLDLFGNEKADEQ